MVAFSPRFAFLATLCAIATLSSAPISDAAVLRLRASDLASTEMASTHTNSEPATWMPRRSSHVVGDAPVLPLPQGLTGSQKKYTDTRDRPSAPPSGGGAHDGEGVFEGHDANDSTYDDNGSVLKKSGNAKAKGRRWNSFRPITRLSESWFGGDRVHYARAPHHHHHHHHHHDRNHRGLKARRSEPARDRDLSSSAISVDGDHAHVGRSPHHNHHHHGGYKKVIVSGDHDHVRIDRSPRSHHHHYHNGHKKVVVSGDHDHVRVDRRSPYHHHHHHHHPSEHEKVVVSGDHDHVRVDRSLDWHHAHEGGKTVNSGETDHVRHQRSVLIAGEQGRSYVVQRVTKRSSSQELFTVPPLGKRAGGLGCAPGNIQIMSPSESGGTFLASLVLASTNSTSSDNSTTSSPAFVLNASESDMTPMCLQASSYNASNPALSPDEIGATLLVEMFDATSASIVPYCATFDPDPPQAAPLTVEECTDDPVGERQSQLFAFNRATGVVRPMWFTTQGDKTDPGSDGCAGGDGREATGNSMQPSEAEVTGDYGTSAPNADQADQSLAINLAVLAADSSEMAPSDSSSGNTSNTQNVDLVFVAMDPVVMGSPEDAGAAISSVPATATGADSSNNAFTATVTSTTMMTTASSTARVAVSSLSSVSASSMSPPSPSTSSSVAAPSGSPTPVPSSTELVSGAHSAPSMVLGIQVVPEPADNTASVAGANAMPTMAPVNTQPYEWLFKLD